MSLPVATWLEWLEPGEFVYRHVTVSRRVRHASAGLRVSAWNRLGDTGQASRMSTRARARGTFEGWHGACAVWRRTFAVEVVRVCMAAAVIEEAIPAAVDDTRQLNAARVRADGLAELHVDTARRVAQFRGGAAHLGLDDIVLCRREAGLKRAEDALAHVKNTRRRRAVSAAERHRHCAANGCQRHVAEDGCSGRQAAAGNINIGEWRAEAPIRSTFMLREAERLERDHCSEQGAGEWHADGQGEPCSGPCSEGSRQRESRRKSCQKLFLDVECSP